MVTRQTDTERAILFGKDSRSIMDAMVSAELSFELKHVGSSHMVLKFSVKQGGIHS